jgi:hypothetical protein
MLKNYLLNKAAECARAAEASSDPTKRQILTDLHKWWINLADESLLIDVEWPRKLQEPKRSMPI